MSRLELTTVTPIEYLDRPKRANVYCNKDRHDSAHNGNGVSKVSKAIHQTALGLDSGLVSEYAARIRALGVCQADVQANVLRTENRLREAQAGEAVGIASIINRTLSSSVSCLEAVTARKEPQWSAVTVFRRKP